MVSFLGRTTLVRESGGHLRKGAETFPPFQSIHLPADLLSKEEPDIKIFDHNGQALRDVKRQPGGVRLTYAVESSNSWARGLIRVRIDLQHGRLDPSFKGLSGILKFVLLERVSQRPLNEVGKDSTK